MQLQGSESSHEYQPTFGCAGRLAELAFNEGNFDKAIENYRLALERDPQHQYAPYVSIRLVLAYALNEEMDSAARELQKLYSNPHKDPRHWPYDLINALWMAYETSPTALSLCRAAHDFVADHPFYIADTIGLNQPGEVKDPERHWSYGEGRYSFPNAAGCNMSRFFNIEPTPYPTSEGTPYPTSTPMPYSNWEAFDDFQTGKYADVITGLDGIKLNEEPEYLRQTYLYMRALALEGLGREDEAAAQFAALAADDSHPEWAALAALHLEPAD